MVNTSEVKETKVDASKQKDIKIPRIVKKTPGHEKWNVAVDYDDKNNWLSFPESVDKNVDVIYYYPSAYTPAEGCNDCVADIDDVGMRQTAQQIFKTQAIVFSESCNIYAPYYRQLHAVYALTLEQKDHEDLFHYAVAQDASNVLDYYFEHCNNGKPFMLAGHSQGSETVMYLLTDYFKKHPDYYKRMICAYVIGYSVTDDFLKKNTSLKFVEGESDTGIIISWNTEGPENIGMFNSVVLDGAKSINPLNWKIDETYASTKENKGSWLDGEFVQNVADAQINLERGTVITNADKKYVMSEEFEHLFGPASFHLKDYGLFFNNLKDNIKVRIEAYFNKKS